MAVFFVVSEQEDEETNLWLNPCAGVVKAYSLISVHSSSESSVGQ